MVRSLWFRREKEADSGVVSDAEGILAKYKKGIIYGVMLLTCLVFVVLKAVSRHNAWGGSYEEMLAVVGEIGVAGIAAVFLAFTVERLSRVEFERLAIKERAAAKEDTFRYVFGYPFPHVVVREFQQQTLERGFTRTDMIVDHTIFPLEGRKDYVNMDATLSYKLHNHKVFAQPYTFRVLLDQPPDDLLAELRFMKLRIEVNKELKINWNEETLRKEMRPNAPPGHTSIAIPEMLIGPQDEASFMIRYKTVKRYDRSYEPILTLQPTIGFDCRVTITGMKFNLTATGFHPSGVKTAVDHDENSGWYRWKIDQPLMPFQGIYVMWNNTPVAGK
jgi:hypothetical protein